MQMNAMTTQTYVADHQARLLADARRSQLVGRNHRSIRRLFKRTRRTTGSATVQPTLAPAGNC